MSSLTHWRRVTHICVSKLTIIGSDNGLSPVRRQAIIWTNAGLLSIGPLGTNFSEILIEILTFSFEKMRLKVSSAKRRPFCLGLNVLNDGADDKNLWSENRQGRLWWRHDLETISVLLVLWWLWCFCYIHIYIYIYLHMCVCKSVYICKCIMYVCTVNSLI